MEACQPHGEFGSAGLDGDLRKSPVSSLRITELSSAPGLEKPRSGTQWVDRMLHVARARVCSQGLGFAAPREPPAIVISRHIIIDGGPVCRPWMVLL